MARGRKRQTSKLSYVAVTVITVAVLCALLAWTGSIKQRNAEYAERESKLYAELEEESVRADQLAEQFDYVKTDDYVKDIAQEQFGLVNDGDMLVVSTE